MKRRVTLFLIATALVVIPAMQALAWPPPQVEGDCDGWTVTEVATDKDWKNTDYWTIDGVDGQFERGQHVPILDDSNTTDTSFMVRWFDKSGHELDHRSGDGHRDLEGCEQPVPMFGASFSGEGVCLDDGTPGVRLEVAANADNSGPFGLYVTDALAEYEVILLKGFYEPGEMRTALEPAANSPSGVWVLFAGLEGDAGALQEIQVNYPDDCAPEETTTTTAPPAPTTTQPTVEPTSTEATTTTIKMLQTDLEEGGMNPYVFIPLSGLAGLIALFAITRRDDRRDN